MGGIWSGFLDIIRVAFEFFTHLSAGNYVIGIILLTLAVRVVLLPLGITQARSMQKMAKVGPRQRELQQKHKGNPKVLQEEIAKLYKEEGVNPASGCLPLLLQIPVMYGLFDVLRSFKYLAHHGLWIWQNLAVPDHTYVLPVLVAASLLIPLFLLRLQTFRFHHQSLERPLQRCPRRRDYRAFPEHNYVATRYKSIVISLHQRPKAPSDTVAFYRRSRRALSGNADLGFALAHKQNEKDHISVPESMALFENSPEFGPFL